MISARAADVAEAARLATEEPRSSAERRSAFQGLGDGIAVGFGLESVFKATK